MSKYYNFELKACKPYQAKTKEKVEQFNHYLKNSFIVPSKEIPLTEYIGLDVQTVD